MASAHSQLPVTIVWGYQSDNPSLFTPFSEKVSNHLEEQYSNNPNNPRVPLKHIAPSMKNYSIDMVGMIQINEKTGSQRQLRRALYNSQSAMGTGIVWEWMADHGWVTYDVDTINAIEAAFSSNQSELDLSSLKCNLPYVVVIDKGYQRNKNTGFVRAIQRKTAAYKTTGITNNVAAQQNSNVTRKRAHHGAAVKPPPYPRTPGVCSSTNLEGAASANVASSSTVPSDDGIMKFCNFVAEVEGDDAECSICLIPFKEDTDDGSDKSSTSADPDPVVELNKCKHCYHQSCMEALYKQGQGNGCIQCPICKTIHGIKMGNQPPGTMHVFFDARHSVSGYPGDGMIVITYNFHSGIQGPNDPNPGARYHAYSFPRKAYLPANAKGKRVLELLKLAWDRRLIFTIGTSVTTGRDHSIVWNEIHHKTSPIDNGSGHGFPDPGYLDNVIEELKQHGIVEGSAV